MASTLITILVVLFSICAGIHQLYIKPILDVLGVGRVVEPYAGKDSCSTVPSLQACEKIVLHQPTGVLYLACSTPESRAHWTPAVDLLNASFASFSDYVATYNPNTARVSRLTVKGYNSIRGLSLHGMDVVPSSSNPDDLFIYLINHRAPEGKDPREVGADSSIEIFKAIPGGQEMVHLVTVENSLIITPNDIVGAPDGKSFQFTNDHGSKTGMGRTLTEFIRPSTSIVYCHVDHGCKVTASKMTGNNGIAKAANDTFYVASSLSGKLSVFERQSDNSLVLTDIIPTDRGMDNISVDVDGVVWAAGLPNVFAAVNHMRNPSLTAPSSALKFSINTGPAAFYGEKFKVEKAFEDDGTTVSGTTSVVHDSERGRLFFHGISAPWLTVCRYNK